MKITKDSHGLLLAVIAGGYIKECDTLPNFYARVIKKDGKLNAAELKQFRADAERWKYPDEDDMIENGFMGKDILRALISCTCVFPDTAPVILDSVDDGFLPEYLNEQIEEVCK